MEQMKLYTEEQVKRAIDIVDAEGEYTNLTYRKILSKLTPIELPSDKDIYWNKSNPVYIDNYIVHRGAEGVSLGWWNGEEWIEMWGCKKLNVYGWIKIPNAPIDLMKEQIKQQANGN